MSWKKNITITAVGFLIPYVVLFWLSVVHTPMAVEVAEGGAIFDFYNSALTNPTFLVLAWGWWISVFCYIFAKNTEEGE